MNEAADHTNALATPGLSHRAASKLLWPAGALLIASSVLFTGYGVYAGNHAFQLPLVYSLNDPALYPGDPFIEAMQRYPSLFWWGVALGARVVPLEAWLFFLFAVEKLLLLAAALRLAGALAPRRALAPLAAAAFLALAPRPFFGQGTIVAGYLEQTGFAIPFCLLAMAELLRGRLRCGAALWAVGFVVNPLYGAYAATYLFASVAADQKIRRLPRVAWISAVGLAFVAILPALVKMAPRLAPGDYDADLWMAAARLALPFHLFPSGVGGGTWARAALFFLFVLLWLRLLRRRNPRLLRHGLAWSGVCAGWLALAVAGERFELVPLILTQAMRAGDLWLALMLVVLACALAAGAEAGFRRRLPRVRNLFFGLILLMFPVCWRSGSDPSLRPYLYILPILLLFAYRLYPFALTRNFRRRIAVFLTAAVLVLNVRGYVRRVQEGERWESALYERPPAVLFEFAVWAHAHTPREARFLVHPLDHRMRTLLKRPIFIAFKDAGVILWDRTYAETFAERMGALGFHIAETDLPLEEIPSRLSRLYADLRDPEIARLRDRYGLDYQVLPLLHPTAFPVVYRNELFKVVRLDEG